MPHVSLSPHRPNRPAPEPRDPLVGSTLPLVALLTKAHPPLQQHRCRLRHWCRSWRSLVAMWLRIIIIHLQKISAGVFKKSAIQMKLIGDHFPIWMQKMKAPTTWDGKIGKELYFKWWFDWRSFIKHQRFRCVNALSFPILNACASMSFFPPFLNPNLLRISYWTLARNLFEEPEVQT